MEPQHYYTATSLRRRTSPTKNTNTNTHTPIGVTQDADIPLSNTETSQPTSPLPTWFEPTSPNSITSSQQQQQRKQRRPTGIFQLPFEILVGQILAILQLCDLARLALVSKAMQQLCQADYLWQRKFFNDFHHRPNKTLRQLGSWKRIYQAMDRVEVYTWGNNGDCRLGYGRTPKKFYESVPKRIRKLDGVGIMELAPTGWGCHALDKNGNVWAWGRIMESNGVRSDSMPRMLKRPRNVVQITAGRQVLLAIDTSGQLWQWCRENKAVEVTLASHPSQLRFSTSSPATVVAPLGIPVDGLAVETNDDPIDQIAAGWDICAALTRSGKIYAWRPPLTADGRYQHRVHIEHSVQLKEQGPDGYEASVIDGDKFVGIAAGTDYVVAVTSFEKVYVFRRLDSPYYNHDDAILSTSAVPKGASHNQYHRHQHQHRSSRHRHHRHHHTDSHYDASGQLLNQMEFEDRIVIEPEIEGCKQERVVEMRGKILGAGLYLPIFSEALAHTVTETYEEHDQWERRQRHHYRRQSWRPPTTSTDTSSTTESSNSNRETSFLQQQSSMPSLPAFPTAPLIIPSSSRPTTLSANFQNFALHHSSGKVLLGKHDVQSNTCPIVLDRLLANACQVEFGDHHQGLLTEDGQLRTWGAFCEGALGHGDLRAGCAIPTVVEGPLKNRFVIKIGMAGCQSACLAIDMSEDRTFGGGGGSAFQQLQQQQYVQDVTPVRFGKERVDDGYYSLEHTSGSSKGGSGSRGGSGSSGSASEGFDSSDGEDWNMGLEVSISQTGQGQGMEETGSHNQQQSHSSGEGSLSRQPPPSQSTASSSPWKFSSVPYMALSPYCTASCSLLVSPHSHRQGSATANSNGNGSGGSLAHARASPLRKRSYSLAGKHHDTSSSAGHRTTSGYSCHYGSGEHGRARMMALTRLSPTLTVYRPTRAHEELSSTGMPTPTSNEVEDMVSQYSQL